MGCCDLSDEIEDTHRRCPSPTFPRTTTPDASGREGKESAMIETAVTDGERQSNLTSPQIPHMNRSKLHCWY